MVFGASAGLLGGILQEVYGYLIKLTGFTDKGYIDFAKAVVFYEIDDGWLGTVLSIIAHLTLDLLLGILFAYIVKNTSRSYYYTKALIYGLATWFILQTAGTVLRLPLFFRVPAKVVLVTLIGAFLYSFGTAYALRLLEKAR